MLKNLDKWMTKIVNVFLVLCLLSGSIIMFLNVILRYVFSSGITGSEELTRFLIIGITFVGGSTLVLNNEHLTMDGIIEKLPKVFKKMVKVFICIVGIVFSMTMFVYSFSVINTLGSAVTPGLQIPSYIPFLAITIGSFFTSIKFVQRAILQLK